ncbi:MAG: peptidoglycan-binding domain-containing protein [Pseudomonadota bacterium]
MWKQLRIATALAALAGPLGAAEIVSPLSHPNHPLLPADAKSSQCFAHLVLPAVREFETVKTQVTPPRVAVDLETGATEVVIPAKWEIRTVERVLRPRQEHFYETLCPQRYTHSFVESLQRALAARGYDPGSATGWLDDPTRSAIRAYQGAKGLNSAIISLKTVEEFGLISHTDFNAFTGN